MYIVNLSSGSKANSTFVRYGETRILIDAGVNEKKLKNSLLEIGEKLEDVNAVFITHEHVDHIRAVKTLAKKYDIDFYVRKELKECGAIDDVCFKEGKLHTFIHGTINVGDLQVNPFDVMHDAVAPVGYTVNVFGSKSRVGFVTDLGVVSETVKKALTGVKIVFIESNYDENMLVSGKYPYLLKQRIAGNKGHLSNAQSLDLARFLYDNGTKCFVLSHISENNNTYELAFSNYVDYFEQNNIQLNKDVYVRVSFQEKRGNNFKLEEDYNGI